MSVSFNGFNEKLLTFKCAAEITAGYPVKISANGTVAACASGDELCGVAVESDSSYSSVKLCGVVTLPYTGSTAPSLGYTSLAADGAGGVSVPASGGRTYLVLSLDSTAGTVTFML